jgi:hypothetical protein
MYTEFAVHQSGQDDVAVPWDFLDTAALKKLLVNPEPFSHVKTLNPRRMTPRDVYDVLDLLLKGQNSGVQLLEFSIRDNFDFNSNLQDDNEISELPDPLTPPPNPRTTSASPGDTGSDNEIADTATEQYTARNVGSDSTITELASDHSVEFCNTESHPRTAIGPKSLPPLSASAAASQNVANTPIRADQNQTPSQQGVNVKTTNSKSKKRTQREMEQEEDSGKQMKRAKLAVPAREQSLRYDASTFSQDFSNVKL